MRDASRIPVAFRPDVSADFTPIRDARAIIGHVVEKMQKKSSEVSLALSIEDLTRNDT